MADVWTEIADGAAEESSLWADCLSAEPDRTPVFSALGTAEHALGLETIYEGYLVHYGRSRLFAPPDDDTALLLGDYLYAHGLVRIAAENDVHAVADLAALISLCSQLRADGASGDGEVWAVTAALLGRGPLSGPRETAALADIAREAAGADALERSLAVHAGRVS